MHTEASAPARSLERGRATALVLVCCALVAIALGMQVLPYRLDDAFITFRFADNFAQGHGIVWNQGGPWVEGFSSPLWFLKLASVSFLFGSGSLPAGASIAGVASLIACFVLSARVLAGERGRWLAPLLLATLVPAVYYAVTGLETVLFLLVALGYVCAALGRLPLWLGLLAGALATWVRPEGPWLLACQLAAVLAAKQRLLDRKQLALAGSLVLGSALLIALRLALFGSLLPNTFYAKPPVVPAGPGYVLEVLASPWAALLCVLGALGAFTGERSHRALFAAGVTWIGAPLLEGGDWMPCGRFLLPTFGFFCLASAGIARVSPSSASRARSAAVIGLIAVTVVSNLLMLRELSMLARSDLESVVYEQRAIADWLARAQVKSVALVDVGEVGYRTPIEVVDLAGLTDARIARARGTHLRKQGLVEYVLGERAPDVVIVRVHGAQPRNDQRVLRELPRFAIAAIERELAVSARLRQEYRQLFAIFPADQRTPFYGRVMYLRNGVALPEAAKPPRTIVYLEPLRM